MLVLIYLQPNANVIETVDQIKALLPELQAALPNDVDLQVVSDRTDHHPRLADARSSAR